MKEILVKNPETLYCVPVPSEVHSDKAIDMIRIALYHKGAASTYSPTWVKKIRQQEDAQASIFRALDRLEAANPGEAQRLKEKGIFRNRLPDDFWIDEYLDHSEHP